MNNNLLLLGLLALTLLTDPANLHAQSPLDVGVHFSPQLRYISSSPNGNSPSGHLTRGKDGLSLGAGAGAYLEYAITDRWYVRGGIDVAYKRNRYATERVMPELDTVRSGSNFISYTSIELPVAVLYRFGYKRHYDTFLVGLGTTLTRWEGSPQFRSSFSRPSKAALDYAPHSLTLFGGYERYLSSVVVLGVEPYLAYVPTRFLLENSTTAKVQAEAGISVRLRLDN